MFDTDMTNKRVLQEVVKCVGMTSPGPHAFVLVVSVGRFTEEEENTVNLFIGHFSEEILNYMIVLFTRRDDIEKSDISIENYIRRVPKTLKCILDRCGNRYIAFDNTAIGEGKILQVKSLINLIKATVRLNGGSFYSNAMYKAAEANIKQLMEIERRKINIKYEKEKAELVEQVSRPLYNTITQNQKQIKKLQMQQEEMTEQQNSERQLQIPDQRNEPSENELRSKIRTKIQKEDKSILKSLCGAFNNAFAGALTGASVGAVAGPIGATIGAVVGGIVGFFKGLFKK